jgi:hypothetical protein
MPKRGELYQIVPKLPNGHKMYQIGSRNIFQRAREYTNLFHSKALQYNPNWNFWFENVPSGNPVTAEKKVLA